MSESEETAQLLWGHSPRARRGPKPRMSLDGIIDAAIAIADAEGLSAVSMQRIADELGMTKMSLYRYVSSKAQVSALMLERAVGAPPDALDHVEGWRTGLTEWALALTDAFSRHLWALDLSIGARVLGPYELAWMEVGLRTLSTTHLTSAERIDTLALISLHVRGLLEQTRPQPSTSTTPSERSTGDIMADLVAAHADRYPQTAQAFADLRGGAGIGDAFHFGMQRILDGLAQVAEGDNP